ncbi:MAG: glycosyltransferase, partial [Elusimicrobia bacterium]|nr:glycosyltransferase [Elusimicrobiota bacterium]
MTDSGRNPNLPLVSVVLAVYNGAETLRQTLQSVLAQTYPNIEVWVVDDGSTDETPEVLRSLQDPRLRVLSLERNVGRSQARNLGVQKAAGELLAMIDADDLWYPDKIAAQARFLNEHREIALCGAWAHLRTEGGEVLDWRQPTDPVSIRRSILWMNPFIHCTLVARKDAFLEAGGYDPALHFAEDYDLALRIAWRRDVANVAHFLAQYRYHTNLLYRWRDVVGKTRARARALQLYGYPLLHFPCLLTPLLSACLPLGVGLRIKPYVEAWRASSESPTRDFLKSAFFKALAVIAGTYAIARVATLASQVWAGKALGVNEYGAANVVLAAAAIFHIVL